MSDEPLPLHPRAERVWRAREELLLRWRAEGLTYAEMEARLGVNAARLLLITERALNRRTDLRRPPEPS
jgi:hypothetical protein